MLELFTQHTVNVAQAEDLVEWRIGSNAVRLYYPTCFKIAAGIRVAGKMAMAHECENVVLWRKLAKYEADTPFGPVHREYRRSGRLSNLKAWRVDIEGSLVAVYLDDFVAKFHFADALVIQAWMNVAARQAKAWAGDDTTGLIITARLTDAEENYKRVA